MGRGAIGRAGVFRASDRYPECKRVAP
jgi:hypothetical protein